MVSLFWLLHSTIMLLYPSMLLYVINGQFLLIAEGYSIVGRSPNLFIYSPVGGHLACFQFGLITE